MNNCQNPAVVAHVVLNRVADTLGYKPTKGASNCNGSYTPIRFGQTNELSTKKERASSRRDISESNEIDKFGERTD